MKINREMLDSVATSRRRARGWIKRLKEIEEEAERLKAVSYSGGGHRDAPSHTSGSDLEKNVLRMLEKKARLSHEVADELKELLDGIQSIRQWAEELGSEEEKAIIEYRCFDGLSWEEVAEEMGGSADALRQKYHRIIEKNNL